MESFLEEGCCAEREIERELFCKCESQDGIFVVRCLVLTGGDSVRKKPKTSSQGGICGERFMFLYVSEFSSQKKNMIITM